MEENFGFQVQEEAQQINSHQIWRTRGHGERSSYNSHVHQVVMAVSHGDCESPSKPVQTFNCPSSCTKKAVYYARIIEWNHSHNAFGLIPITIICCGSYHRPCRIIYNHNSVFLWKDGNRHLNHYVCIEFQYINNNCSTVLKRHMNIDATLVHYSELFQIFRCTQFGN